jgi:hypothetical protein
MAITDQQIEDLAASPQRARTDEGSVQERSVTELIKAAQYIDQRALSYAPWGIRVARAYPTDTLGRP